MKTRDEILQLADKERRDWVEMVTEAYMNRKPTEEELQLIGRVPFEYAYVAGYKEAKKEEE
jgi:hypothetical protein